MTQSYFHEFFSHDSCCCHECGSSSEIIEETESSTTFLILKSDACALCILLIYMNGFTIIEVFFLLFRIGIENEEWVISLLSHLCWELHMCSADLTRLVVTRRPLTTTSVFSLFFKLSACLNKVGWKSMSKPASWKLLCLKWRRNQRVQPGVVFFITADWSCCR